MTSRQSEDHERGIEAATEELARWRPVNDTAMVARAVADAYLARVSPSRDGTAVEALRAIRTFAGEGPHTRMGEACGIDACIGCLIYATADEALADSNPDRKALVAENARLREALEAIHDDSFDKAFHSSAAALAAYVLREQ